jgi:hypothetical protein
MMLPSPLIETRQVDLRLSDDYDGVALGDSCTLALEVEARDEAVLPVISTRKRKAQAMISILNPEAPGFRPAKKFCGQKLAVEDRYEAFRMSFPGR